MILITNNIDPIVVDIIAEYAIGQKSAGEPSHNGIKRIAATIKIHSHNETWIQFWVKECTNCDVRRRNTEDAPIRVTFIKNDTMALVIKLKLIQLVNFNVNRQLPHYWTK